VADLHIGQTRTAATAERWHRADSGRWSVIVKISLDQGRSPGGADGSSHPGRPTHLVEEVSYLRYEMSVESPAMRSSDRDLDPTAWGNQRGFATGVCHA